MKSKHTTTTNTAEKNSSPATSAIFEKINIRWMLIGAAVIILGFILMAGGASNDPTVFNENEVYSTTRITIAPLLILAGLVIEIYAIFRNPKKD